MKKPTEKQLEARRLFAERARAGLLKRKGAKKARKNPAASSVKPPSPTRRNPRARKAVEWQAGDVARFDGSALDGSYSGSSDVTIIDPHVNASEVFNVEGGREYNRQGQRHLRIARVKTPDRRDRKGREMLVYEHHLKRIETKANPAESIKVPAPVRAAARRGLALRQKWGRGGLTTRQAGAKGIGSGVQRAADLAAGSVGLDTVYRMRSYLARAEKGYQPDKMLADGGPTAGTIAYLLWGGPAGKQWADRILARESNPVPPSSRAGKRASVRTQIDKAASLYERFSGHNPEVIGRVKVPDIPKVGVAIGTVDGILYTTVRDGVTEKYIHQFRAKDKPAFVVSPDGKQLFMIGGHYDFTERGIVDRSDKRNR